MNGQGINRIQVALDLTVACLEPSLSTKSKEPLELLSYCIFQLVVDDVLLSLWQSTSSFLALLLLLLAASLTSLAM